MIEESLAEASQQHRGYLLGLAFRLLGSLADAEDVVQEALLRFRQALADGIRPNSDRAYLTTITTRLAIDQLRSARVRREQYVGPWLPEPLVEEYLTGPMGPSPGDPVDDLVKSESASSAFLVLLERLTPEQRAVFVLHEVFGFPYADIGSMINKTASACRQLAVRARDQLATERPRFAATRAQGDALARAFLAACQDGDLPGLLELLLPETQFVGDGGASGRGFPRVIIGADRVARLVAGASQKLTAADFRISLVHVGGQPALCAQQPDGIVYAIWSLVISDGAIAAIHGVTNPDKLRHLSG